ncbi:Quinone oxidoreductase [Minicystis rosea]|nr:Quinone oxidoreductase [Minicystis rosea]
MKAIRLDRHGGPEVLELHDVPIPEPRRGEVVVRVAHAGVNFADINLRKTGYPGPIPLPVTPGLEAAGIVEAVGEGVTRVRAGDRVTCLAFAFGAYAEQVRVAEAHVVPLPDDVGFEHAAALTLQGLTAHDLLCDVPSVRRGATVLVHAAAGGMGLLLCQWAHRQGARVIGTVSTPEKAAAAREAGADHVILYGEDDFVSATKRITGGKGADYIIDGVGKDTFAKNLEAVATRGHITFYGWASGAPEPLAPATLMAKSISVSGGNLLNAVRSPEEMAARARDVFEGLRAGWLRPRIAGVFPLAEAAEAHRRLEGRNTIGKVLLEVRR